MGSGSGILSEAAKKSKIKNIFAADIDEESINITGLGKYIWNKICKITITI